MKEIKFTKLSIKNFRNINELEIEFGENQTIFRGQNKLGKTNILHSVLWCLFGKNIYNEKQFTISPIINNIEDNSINTNVKLVINNEYVISRSYKDRTTKLEVGFIDSENKENLVSMTQGQYLEDLKSKYVDEETFKSLSNYEYITSVHWKDLKELIFELIGGINDEEVLLREDFNLIEELVKNFGIERTLEQVIKTDKELSEEIKRLETEYQTTFNMKEKYVTKNEDNEKLLARKKEIENTLSKTKDNEEKNNKLREQEYSLRNKIDDVKRNVSKLENEIDFAKNNILEYQKLYDSSSNSVDELREQDKRKASIRVEEVKNDVESNWKTIENSKYKIAELKKQGNELKTKEVKVENETCPTCKQTLPEKLINETLSIAKKQRENELLELKDQLDKEKIMLSDHEEDLIANQKHLDNLTKELEELDKKEYVVEESDRQKQLRIAKETKELEVKELEKTLELYKKELPTLEKEYENLEKLEMIQEDNLPLILELDEINSQLATTTTLSKLEEDLESIKNNLDAKKDNKVANKEKQQQCVKFNNIKADLLKQKVSKYFKLVNFRTKELTLDGQEVETFKITNENNVGFNECSQGEKILLGVELLTVIQDFKEIRLPLILDEITVLTSELDSKSQIIGTVADKSKSKIEVEIK